MTEQIVKNENKPTVNKNQDNRQDHMVQDHMVKGQMGLLEEMVYIISHDLQVPLISIEGYATELLEMYQDKLDENGLYCLDRLKANTLRMYRLVISLLDISRLNTRKYPYESFEPLEIVRGIVREYRLSDDTPDAHIQIEEMPRVQGDKRRLEGVFRRLIINALVYGAKNITIGYSNNTWFVQDDGIGIPKDQLANIFKSGERLKRVEVDGVGMGLTYCKYVIHQHGGRIWADSDGENKGTTFCFTLNEKK